MLSHKLYVTTRIIAATLYLWVLQRIFLEDYMFRILGSTFLLLEFLVISHLYEKKRKNITPGYIFLFVIGFMEYVLAATYYTDNQLKLESKKYIGVPSDHYDLYFSVMALFWIIVGFVIILKNNKHYSNKGYCSINAKNFLKKEETIVSIVGLGVCLPLSLIREMFAIFYVPILCYFILDLFYKRKLNTRIAVGIVGFFLCLYKYGTVRYLMIEFIFPIIITLVMLYGKKKIKLTRFLTIGAIFVVGILLYGVLSEIVKLNLYYHRDYDIKVILTSNSQLKEFIIRQIYRLIGIWIRLGGNIIEHVQRNGYYYGLSYIKSLASFLNLPYISLPVISAGYVQATYAQPGLLAEGYANFGFIGAIVNILIPFLIAEKLYFDYANSGRVISLCICVIPFTKVLLDGGSINSIIFSYSACLLAYFIIDYKRILYLE